MRFCNVISLALCAAAAVAQQSLDVSSIFSHYYGSYTPSLSPAASTSLASLLHSVDASWIGSPAERSANAAIISAAPSSLQFSYAHDGYNYNMLQTASWYIENVPTELQSSVRSYVTAWYSAEAKVLSTTTGTSASTTPASITPTSTTSASTTSASTTPASTTPATLTSDTSGVISTVVTRSASTAGAVMTGVSMIAGLMGLAGGVLAAL